MRFDDSLKTVLAADASTAFGAQATFRQLADLVARGRVPANDETLGRLRALRDQVPVAVRGAVARGLALGRPPTDLIALFAEDEPAIAAAALRAARLSAEEWIALLPQLGPTGRAVLRGREDLDPAVQRALESFGVTDFTIGYVAPAPVNQPASPPIGSGPFTAIGAITAALPVVESARWGDAAPQPEPRDGGGFEIAELVDRIATFQRERTPLAPTVVNEPDSFRFETKADGTIRWTDAVPRGALVGASIVGSVAADDVVGEAVRRRASFTDARLMLGSATALAGEWRISAAPLFEPDTGRFTGYRGSARRYRSAEPAMVGRGGAEGLRRLVHELRTPTNAIAGFSELIEAQLLGPVEPPYRERATTIRSLAADLVAAIEDLDLAARIDGAALELRTATVMIAPLLSRVAADLKPLTVRRGSGLAVAPMDAALTIAGDDRALERLIARLASALVSASGEGEALAISAARAPGGQVAITITRPRALTGISDEQLLSLDPEREVERAGSPLLGIGFVLRLARNLAVELGGNLAIEADRLIVTLPAAPAAVVGQAATV